MLTLYSAFLPDYSLLSDLKTLWHLNTRDISRRPLGLGTRIKTEIFMRICKPIGEIYQILFGCTNYSAPFLIFETCFLLYNE